MRQEPLQSAMWLSSRQSCLNIVVSCVKNYYSKQPKPVNLLTWLNTDKYCKTVLQIRDTEDKQLRTQLKGSLPAITPSGVFRYVNEQGLIQHTGFIQFDIDLKDNIHLANYETLHNQLRNISNIAYCGKSVSGRGYWGLVRIGYPHKHAEHLEFLRRAMKRLGITIDAAPSNVCSLRGASYDASAYYNHNAPKMYHYVPQVHPEIYNSSLRAARKAAGLKDKLNAACVIIRDRNIDITDTYTAWFGIGCDLAATWGEDGRQHFHFLSCRHPKYTQKETDYQYDNCKKYVLEQKRELSINYLLKRCREYGVKV